MLKNYNAIVFILQDRYSTLSKISFVGAKEPTRTLVQPLAQQLLEESERRFLFLYCK
jgi:hypothetical protein